MRIKAFHIKHEPTKRNEPALIVKLETIINEWLDDNNPKDVKISVSAETKTEFPEVFVLISYK